MLMPLRTLIVDDEPIARARLQVLCADLSERVEVVAEASSGTEALARITADSFDLMLLDIAMPDLDGLDVARALAQASTPPAVIFCTAFSGHALQAFDAAAVDYLLKPVSRERLGRAVVKTLQLRAGRQGALPPRWLDHLWVPHRDAMLRIELTDVRRVEAEGDYVRIVTAQASYLLHETMARLEARLDPNRFIRIRRSLIVRIDLVTAVEHQGGGTWEVMLSDGTAVRVGPTYWKALKAIITNT